MAKMFGNKNKNSKVAFHGEQGENNITDSSLGVIDMNKAIANQR